MTTSRVDGAEAECGGPQGRNKGTDSWEGEGEPARAKLSSGFLCNTLIHFSCPRLGQAGERWLRLSLKGVALDMKLTAVTGGGLFFP